MKRIEHTIQHRLDPWSQRLDYSRGKALVHQLTQPAVFGRIHEKHPQVKQTGKLRIASPLLCGDSEQKRFRSP
jgi:hypothetical protein